MRAAATVLLAVALAAPSVSRAEFMSGSMLSERLEANERVRAGAHRAGDISDSGFAIGFVTGVFDVYVNLSFCAPASVTIGQVARISLAFLRANPARLHENAYKLVRDALESSFPACERRQQSPSQSL